MFCVLLWTDLDQRPYGGKEHMPIVAAVVSYFDWLKHANDLNDLQSNNIYLYAGLLCIYVHVFIQLGLFVFR